MNNEKTAKILPFTAKNRRFFRTQKYTWNYFKTLFFISLSFNFLLFMLLVLKIK